MTEIKLIIDEEKMKELIYDYVKSVILLDDEFSSSDVVIGVKSKQNFSAEWEPANFRAEYSKTLYE